MQRQNGKSRLNQIRQRHVQKRNVHTKQAQPFPQPFIRKNGVLERIFVTHDEEYKEQHGQHKSK
jgi:hypothetical protein